MERHPSQSNSASYTSTRSALGNGRLHLGKLKLISHQRFVTPVPKGIYLYGDVGCGKTMLMDLFCEPKMASNRSSRCLNPRVLTLLRTSPDDTLPASVANSKRRVHFHAFMEDVHKRTHKMSQSHKPGQDVIVPIARQLAKEARVLCFDEFQVSPCYSMLQTKRSLNSYRCSCRCWISSTL